MAKPPLKMDIKLKMPHISFRTVTSVIFVVIVLAEVGMTLDYVYKYLISPVTPVVSNQAVLTADLTGYSQVYTDLNSRTNYEPQEFIYQNSNPFKFSSQ